uniref:Uncharacterized protein n=1 Tax=Oryza barthii TaxID=65489 RepID=A0A0D3GNT7_9ORYZ
MTSIGDHSLLWGAKDFPAFRPNCDCLSKYLSSSACSNEIESNIVCGVPTGSSANSFCIDSTGFSLSGAKALRKPLCSSMFRRMWPNTIIYPLNFYRRQLPLELEFRVESWSLKLYQIEPKVLKPGTEE